MKTKHYVIIAIVVVFFILPFLRFLVISKTAMKNENSLQEEIDRIKQQ